MRAGTSKACFCGRSLFRQILSVYRDEMRRATSRPRACGPPRLRCPAVNTRGPLICKQSPGPFTVRRRQMYTRRCQTPTRHALKHERRRGGGKEQRAAEAPELNGVTARAELSERGSPTVTLTVDNLLFCFPVYDPIISL